MPTATGSKPPGPRGCAPRVNRTACTLLLNSKIDYFLMDELVVQYLVASYPEEARTRLAIGTIPLHHAVGPLVAAPVAAGRRRDHQGLQHAVARDDRRSHVSPAAPRGLDPRRRRWRRQGRIRRRERSGRLDAAEACLRLVLANSDDAGAVRTAGTGTLFLWRLRLQRLVVGAGQVQGRSPRIAPITRTPPRAC